LYYLRALARRDGLYDGPVADFLTDEGVQAWRTS